MYSKPRDSPVKFNFVLIYALKIKSKALMAITAAHFKQEASLAVKGGLKHFLPSTFSVETLVSATLLFQTL